MNIEKQVELVEQRVGKEVMDEVLTDETRIAMLMNSVSASKKSLQGLLEGREGDITPATKIMEGAVTAYNSVEQTYKAYADAETYRDAVRNMAELNAKNREEVE